MPGILSPGSSHMPSAFFTGYYPLFCQILPLDGDHFITADSLNWNLPNALNHDKN